MFRAQMTHVVTASLLLLASVPLSAQTTATKVLSDQILPKDTYLYFSCPSVSAMKDHIKASSLGKLWADPALDSFKAEVRGAIDNELQEELIKINEAIGMSLDEALSIPQGEVTVAISGGPSSTMGAVVFLDFGDKESEVLSLLDRAVDALSDAPKLSHEEESFDGTPLTMFRIEYDGPAPTPLAKEFGWFVKDQRLVISNRSELLEAALSNWAGDASDSFIKNETYSYIMSRCQTGERTALSTVYFDPIGLFKKLVDTGSLGQASFQAGIVMGTFQSLGLTQMKAMGTVSEAGTGAFEAVSRSVLYSEQPPVGVMEVFQFDKTATTPPDWVKENVNAYLATKWKVGEAFTAVETLVDNFFGVGTVADRLNMIAKRGPEVHLKDDVLDQLNGEIKVITAAGEGDGYGGDQMLLALGVHDDKAAGGVLARIAAEAGMETRDFRGATIHEIEGPNNQSVKLSVSGGRFMFCMGTALLEQVLRNDNDMRPLAEAEDFKRVAEHFPTGAMLVQFSRPAEQYRSLYELLRSGTAAEQFPGMDEIFEKIDFTTLPPFDTVAKYVHPTGGYSKKDDNGMYVEAFQLKD